MGDRTAPPALVLAQALANTLDVESGEDRLASPHGLAEFLREHELTDLGLTPAELPRITELREMLRACALAHTGTDLADSRLRSTRRLLREAPLVLEPDRAGAVRVVPRPSLHGVPALTARLAVGIAAAADGSWQRLKACEAEDCRWVFYDRSPAGRGRWCTMAVCGSRAKMRTYRAARRAT
ncbi:CGNR zinc finger domain-containing protein [Streptomyces oceani]|uniref:Zinc finger CGNR domain-containing protein n=1 Tax=Streptomyces oceani TaxID=1075402 RepID=A0A1E7KNJ1_9ACTN|nr:CGNR zinc finger domain-containing protein [Streptomyces oceani]OEV05456.1 hypothetical protein AN216_03045 [Streptomyces oceani]